MSDYAERCLNMTSQVPLVSVVMCNYNTKEEQLRSAIQSILSQTFGNFEFIIIDDASTENDVEIINSYADPRIKLLRNDINHHVSYTANRGLELAQGKYIARMDSDDICLPTRLEEQVGYMQKHPDVDVLYAQAKLIGNREGIFAPGFKQSDLVKVNLFFGCPIVNPTVMLRASFVEKHHLRYDTGTDFKAAEDYELWSRCISSATIHEYPKVLIHYRVHPTQISTLTRDKQIESANRVRRRMLDWIKIVPDQHEMAVHYAFCTDSVSPQVTLAETESWAQRLLDGNRSHKVFNQRFFKNEVVQHFFVLAVKSIAQKRISLGQALKLPIMRQALSPVNYYRYFRRFLFSKRLNRVI